MNSCSYKWLTQKEETHYEICYFVESKRHFLYNQCVSGRSQAKQRCKGEEMLFGFPAGDSSERRGGLRERGRDMHSCMNVHTRVHTHMSKWNKGLGAPFMLTWPLLQCQRVERCVDCFQKTFLGWALIHTIDFVPSNTSRHDDKNHDLK